MKFRDDSRIVLQFQSRPARALWIEIIIIIVQADMPWSRPARALWIEIQVMSLYELNKRNVEAREGLVD